MPLTDRIIPLILYCYYKAYTCIYKYVRDRKQESD